MGDLNPVLSRALQPGIQFTVKVHPLLLKRGQCLYFSTSREELKNPVKNHDERR